MRFMHVTLMVINMEESLRFYREIIGLPLNRRFSAGPETEIAFLGGETEIELICRKGRGDISVGPDISLGFAVASLEDTIVYLQQNGITAGPILQPNPQTRFVYITDPNGVKIQFMEAAAQ